MMDKFTNQYSLFDKIRLVVWVMRSKLIAKSIRIIRFPIDIRGRKYIEFGQGFTTGRNCRMDVFDSMSRGKCLIFGKNVQLNDNVHIVCDDSITIGDNVLMASHIFISDCSHGYYKGDENDTPPTIPPAKRPLPSNPIKIGNNVWIGEGVIVMPGVTIGDGCVIGAHSIVSKDVPTNTIAVGSPLRFVKHYNNDTKRWERI